MTKLNHQSSYLRPSFFWKEEGTGEESKMKKVTANIPSYSCDRIFRSSLMTLSCFSAAKVLFLNLSRSVWTEDSVFLRYDSSVCVDFNSDARDAFSFAAASSASFDCLMDLSTMTCRRLFSSTSCCFNSLNSFGVSSPVLGLRIRGDSQLRGEDKSSPNKWVEAAERFATAGESTPASAIPVLVRVFLVRDVFFSNRRAGGAAVIFPVAGPNDSDDLSLSPVLFSVF